MKLLNNSVSCRKIDKAEIRNDNKTQKDTKRKNRLQLKNAQKI